MVYQPRTTATATIITPSTQTTNMTMLATSPESLPVESTPSFPPCTRRPSTVRWRLNCCSCHRTSTLTPVSKASPSSVDTSTLSIPSSAAGTASANISLDDLPILPRRCTCAHTHCQKSCLFFSQRSVWECPTCTQWNDSNVLSCPRILGGKAWGFPPSAGYGGSAGGTSGGYVGGGAGAAGNRRAIYGNRICGTKLGPEAAWRWVVDWMPEGEEKAAVGGKGWEKWITEKEEIKQ